MLFTSEQVSQGHPDKICDQISDAILTDCLKHDPNCRVAVECMIKDYEIILAGEMTTDYARDYTVVTHEVLRRIGVPDTAVSRDAADHLSVQGHCSGRGS